jgi:Zn-dependent protease/CBS domain-containing protein
LAGHRNAGAGSGRSGPVRRRGAAGLGGLYIGRWLGIEFYLHYSWFIIAAFVTYQLAEVGFPMVYPGLPHRVYLALGLIAALLFFACILLHELGHSVVSQRCGIPVPRITLLFIGGLAEIAREPDDARSELKIALGGPAVTVVLVGVFALLEWLCDARGWLGAALVAGWLWQINLGLVLFNMFPGYPLDGGRVLRAILWARSGKFRRSTYISSRIGIGFSWLLLVGGLYALLVKHQPTAILLVLIAIFLKGAAESGYAHAVQRELLAGVRVRDFMTPHPAMLPDTLPLNLAVDDYFLTNHHKAYPVCAADGKFRGLLRLDALKSVPREKWPYTTTGDVVAEAGADRLHIAAGEGAARAMRLLLAAGTSRLAVLEEGKVVGIVTRRDIGRFIAIRTELEE